MARTKAFDEKEVLERARDLFWERGYEATSIQELEEATGLSRSSLYRFFGGKRALFDRTLAEYRTENQVWLREHFSRETDLRSALRQFFFRATSAMVPEGKHCGLGCYVVNVTTELAAVDEATFAFVSANRERFVEIIGAALQRGRDDGQLPPDADPDALAEYLFTAYSGIQVVVKTGIAGERLLKTVDRIIDGVFL